MPTSSIAKRIKGKIIPLGAITEGEPNKDHIKAAAQYFIYLTEKYGIESNSFCEEKINNFITPIGNDTVN